MTMVIVNNEKPNHRWKLVDPGNSVGHYEDEDIAWETHFTLPRSVLYHRDSPDQEWVEVRP